MFSLFGREDIPYFKRRLYMQGPLVDKDIHPFRLGVQVCRRHRRAGGDGAVATVRRSSLDIGDRGRAEEDEGSRRPQPATNDGRIDRGLRDDAIEPPPIDFSVGGAERERDLPRCQSG